MKIVVGRGDGATMRPDVDLSELARAESRPIIAAAAHVADHHNKMNTLSVSDMRSANGTFING
ncbi:MAG: hypothetical protein IPK17_14100 [Chloroflexi bacterium]|uniref:hypothetical protein n=1 Tax=Candidatus Flexifilum breve TaxID=3140694 RepID=UPI003135A5D6|nr:hypothetical protein [Chloroflexota bacterium]